MRAFEFFITYARICCQSKFVKILLLLKKLKMRQSFALLLHPLTLTLSLEGRGEFTGSIN